MILSNVEIQRALEEGRLGIEPVPHPVRPSKKGDYCPYQTSSVDLRLGDEISYFREGLALNIDLRRGKFPDLFGPNCRRLTITEQQPFALEPGRLVLGKTLEKVRLARLDDGRNWLAGRIEGKSSYARCGVLVHFTAPTIHAGFSGTITLELINLGPLPVMLYPGAPICQLIVEEVAGTPFQNDSQFQNQSQAGGHSR